MFVVFEDFSQFEIISFVIDGLSGGNIKELGIDFSIDSERIECKLVSVGVVKDLKDVIRQDSSIFINFFDQNQVSVRVDVSDEIGGIEDQFLFLIVLTFDFDDQLSILSYDNVLVKVLCVNIDEYLGLIFFSMSTCRADTSFWDICRQSAYRRSRNRSN